MRFKAARHALLAKVTSGDRCYIEHLGPNCCRDEAMVAKSPVRWIEANPSGSRQVDLNPGMKTALRPSVFHVNVELAEEPADHTSRQALLPQNRSAEQRRIAAGARSEFQNPGRETRFALNAGFVGDLAVKRRNKIN